MRSIRWFPVMAAAAAAAIGISACGSAEEPASRSAEPPRRAARAADAPTPADARPRIVILGDSLTAGLGLPPEQSFPAILQQQVDAADLNLQIVNAGVSGDTSAGGLRRLDWALEGDVRILVLALGANDGLRGISAGELRRNLAEIIERSRARGIEVVLAGMEAPPNFGHAYTAEFRQVYTALAREHKLSLVPFLLDGVAGFEAMNQRDGIHPTAEGARKVADNVWRVLRPLAENAVRAAPGDRPRAHTP